tara:strand:+ start:7012 stop:8070 length:1059 start_codon:yes stop_codon:yes gene_type:complete
MEPSKFQTKKKSQISVSSLLKDIQGIIKKARHTAFYAINKEMLISYFKIGKRIVEGDQKGVKRAEYGEKLLELVSRHLTAEFGSGFSVDNLEKMRRFYLLYKNRISVTLSRKSNSKKMKFPFELSWSHYCELIKIEDPTKRLYFEKYTSQENLSVRDLKRQIYSFHYERLLMTKNNKKLLTLENKKLIPQNTSEMIKDPYVLEFLDLDEKHQYTEKDLETQVLDKLQKFLLELGKGFSFVDRQKRITLDDDHFYFDLLFYNIYLKCYVIIDLKIGKFKHEYAGQMNFYINYIKKNLNKIGDAEPIGIILCTKKNDIYVEYALSGISNKLFVSKYQLYLPTQKELENEVRKSL